MNTRLRSRYGYFNITAIDAEGKPTTTQLYSDDPTLPIEWIVNRVTACGIGKRTSVVAAYLFDTRMDLLQRFEVHNGRLMAVRELSGGGTRHLVDVTGRMQLGPMYAPGGPEDKTCAD